MCANHIQTHTHLSRAAKPAQHQGKAQDKPSPHSVKTYVGGRTGVPLLQYKAKVRPPAPKGI
eukprot:7034742-Pyramimonas_sp.AAC.1